MPVVRTKKVVALAYTSARRNAEATAVAEQLRRRIIRVADYNTVINRLNAEQVAINNKKVRKTEARKTTNGKTLVTFVYSYKVAEKGTKGTKTVNKEGHILVPAGGSVEDALRSRLDKIQGDLEADSPLDMRGKVEGRITSAVRVASAKVDKTLIPMRDATALDLDGEVIQTWDKKQNTCVYDFLIWRYSEVRGCKKVCTYEALDEIFWPVDGGDAVVAKDVARVMAKRTSGICIKQIEKFCEKVGTPMYAFDEVQKILCTYKPTKQNKNVPPLVFKIKDNHFYAILDKTMTLSRCGKGYKTDMAVVEGKAKEAEEVTVEMVSRAEGETGADVMVRTMREVAKQVYPFKNIQMTEDGIKSFTLDGKRFVFDDDNSVATAIKIAEANEEAYCGDSTYSILMKMMTELKYEDKSHLNPFMNDLLTTEGVKWRTHYGATPAYRGEDLVELVRSGEAECYDIAKCYTSCLMYPSDEFLVLDFNDTFVPYAGEPIVPGLYYVETDDMTLFHSDNIYSHTILQFAQSKGIPFKIISRCIPTRKALPKNYFQPLLDEIDKVCCGRPELKKMLTNIITGFLGKHSTKKYVCRMNTDAETVWDDFTKADFQNNETFLYKIDEFYIYGFILEKELSENNIPIYIQILDWSNIRLYEMIELSGGVALWRKTDSAVVRGGKLELAEYAEPGMYRKADAPTVPTRERTWEERKVQLCTIDDDWTYHPEITSSSQVDDVFNLLLETKGIANVSRAGTGKSYNLMEVEKKFQAKFPESKVYKIAFTNKASLNIRGTTIHKFLKIDAKGRFNLAWLESLRSTPVLIEIDEVSMISQYLWRRLVELKRVLPDAYFVLCGDYRQVPPVEPGCEYFDYFNCSAMKFLANYHRIEFTVRQRYDEALWDVAEKVWAGDAMPTEITVHSAESLTPELLKDKNVICYTNATRKRINAMMNHYYAGYIPVYQRNTLLYDGDDKDIQQETIIYKGLPIMAITNKSGEDGEMMMVNNECFEVVDFSEESMTATTKRVNDEGEEYEHTITIEFSEEPDTQFGEEFHTMFVMNYCSTTHKSQGATIDNDIVLMDWPKMSKNLKYTAITRAKKLSQISICA